jgi:hypothetical protein
MNRAQESPLESEIGDFAEILRHEDAKELPVVVGGHAAGLWSRYFLSRGVTELAEFLPFRSNDLDLVGVFARIPLPHLMLKAKLANSALIKQDGRQDVKHTKMMLICVRAFILELLENHQGGLIGERPVVNLL